MVVSRLMLTLALAARSKMPTAFRCIAARRRACRVNSSSHSIRCCQTGRNVSVGKSTGMLVAGPSHPPSLDSAKFALIFFLGSGKEEKEHII